MPLKYRKKILLNKFGLINEESGFSGIIHGGYFKRVKSDFSEHITSLQEYAQNLNCEGLVLKMSASKYDYSGKRSGEWLKLKNQGLSMQDTLDLVPIGGFYGRGKRSGTIGAYLMASYNRESGQFESICKVGTGLKDDDLQVLSEHFKDKTVDEKPLCYVTNQS